MKITEVRVIVTCPLRNYVVVKIMTDEPGLYGVGDATLNGRELAVAAALQEHIAPLLIGRDPDRIEDTWQMLFRGAYWRGGPVLMTALASIDIALWDIKGGHKSYRHTTSVLTASLPEFPSLLSSTQYLA